MTGLEPDSPLTGYPSPPYLEHVVDVDPVVEGLVDNVQHVTQLQRRALPTYQRHDYKDIPNR